jgi:hypothetical protein
VRKFSPFVNFEVTFVEEIDPETKIFEEKVLIEFKNVFKTGLRTKIRQRVPEIYHFSDRKPHKLEIPNVSKMKKKY